MDIFIRMIVISEMEFSTGYGALIHNANCYVMYMILVHYQNVKSGFAPQKKVTLSLQSSGPRQTLKA